MAKKTQNNNKGFIIGGCIIAAIIVLVIIISATASNQSWLNDSYFVSDGTKYVISQENTNTESDSEIPTPTKSHLVYYYKDDDITDMKAFYEFTDSAAAKTAYDYYKEAGDGNFKEIALDGKYIILTANESEYSDYKASDVKREIEFEETLKNANTGEGNTSDDADNESLVDEPTEDSNSQPNN